MHSGVRKCLTNFTLTAKTLKLNTSPGKEIFYKGVNTRSKLNFSGFSEVRLL